LPRLESGNRRGAAGQPTRHRGEAGAGELDPRLCRARAADAAHERRHWPVRAVAHGPWRGGRDVLLDARKKLGDLAPLAVFLLDTAAAVEYDGERTVGHCGEHAKDRDRNEELDQR
jgi:hypothetical protein